MPFATRIAPDAIAHMCGRALALSVRLTASARPWNGSALSRSRPGSPDSGGTKCYFHQSQFTDDGKRMVISDGRRGVQVEQEEALPA